MIHSLACQHALRAVIYLAAVDDNRPVLALKIAEEIHAPHQMLAKVLHGLTGKGLVASTKGPGGGYRLARPAAELHVIDVIEAVDGPLRLSSRCILGLDECTDDASCALHDVWKVFRDQYASTVTVMTLEAAAKVLDLKRQAGAAGNS